MFFFTRRGCKCSHFPYLFMFYKITQMSMYYSAVETHEITQSLKTKKIKDWSITSNLFVIMFDSISVVCWGQSSDLSVPHFPPLELFLFSQSQKIVCLLGSAFSVCRLVPLSELLQKLGLEMVPETEST